jgi:hypothetical protein
MGYQCTHKGLYDHILYFEYEDEQVSFHDLSSRGLPPFTGEWIGYPQSELKDFKGKIPAHHKNVRNKTH